MKKKSWFEILLQKALIWWKKKFLSSSSCLVATTERKQKKRVCLLKVARTPNLVQKAQALLSVSNFQKKLKLASFAWANKKNELLAQF